MKLKIESAFAEPGAEPWQGGFKESMTLDEIFRFFNRVDAEDCTRLAMLEFNQPSMSVGDLVTVDDVTYKVCSLGFERIETGPVPV